jgi:hypothetical protein
MPCAPSKLNRNPPTSAPTIPRAMSRKTALVDNLAANKARNEAQYTPANNSHGASTPTRVPFILCRSCFRRCSSRFPASAPASAMDGHPPGDAIAAVAISWIAVAGIAVSRIAVAVTGIAVGWIAIASSVIRCGWCRVGRITIAAVVCAVTNSACSACINCAASCAAICPSLDACNAQRCQRSPYTGISTVKGQRQILLRPLKREGRRGQQRGTADNSKHTKFFHDRFPWILRSNPYVTNVGNVPVDVELEGAALLALSR